MTKGNEQLTHTGKDRLRFLEAENVQLRNKLEAANTSLEHAGEDAKQLRAQLKQLDLDREAERHKRIEAEARVEKMQKALEVVSSYAKRNIMYCGVCHNYHGSHYDSCPTPAVMEALRGEAMTNSYLVITPPYGDVLDGYGSDVVEVQAATKREALVKGLRLLRAMPSSWIRDAEGDGRCPFTGLKAERSDVEDDPSASA